MEHKIKDWIDKIRHNIRYLPPVFDDWPDKLWGTSNKNNEIEDYIHERFLCTLNRTEYYYSMFYLDKLVPHDMLFVYFEHSPQYINYHEHSTKWYSGMGMNKTHHIRGQQISGDIESVYEDVKCEHIEGEL